MGATNELVVGKGTDYASVYSALVERARFEYGDDPYNGSCTTMRLVGRPEKVADTYSKNAEKKAMAIIEKDDWGEKRQAWCLDLGVVEYELSRFEKVPHTSADVIYETFFAVLVDNCEISTFKSASEARAYASELLGKYTNADEICVRKVSKPTKKGASSTVALWERKTRTLKSKPKKVPAGATLREVHVFWYYGWAAI